MEKADLKKIKDTLNEIASLQKTIQNLEHKVKPHTYADTVQGSSTCFPYGARTFKIEGVDITKYDRQLERMRRKYEADLLVLMELVAEANEFISQQPDPEVRNILRLKYVNGLEWIEIGEEVHMSARGAQKILKKWWET